MNGAVIVSLSASPRGAETSGLYPFVAAESVGFPTCSQETVVSRPEMTSRASRGLKPLE